MYLTQIFFTIFLLSSAFAAEASNEGKSKTNSPVAQYVANQIEGPSNGDCNIEEGVAKESCLIFQGAIAMWSNFGFQEDCPLISKSTVFVERYAKEKKDTHSKYALYAKDNKCFSYIYAINVANTVPILINSANYRFKLNLGKGYSGSQNNVENSLKERSGICGNQAALGVRLFEEIGLRSRLTEFYYKSNGRRKAHVIPEVLVSGRWYPVDTTYGAYWINDLPNKPFQLATLSEIMDKNNNHIREFSNSALLPFGMYSVMSNLDNFDYLTNDPDIVINGAGVIRITLDGDAGIETLRDVPNFIGKNKSDAVSDGISYQFITNDYYRITIKVSGVGKIGSGDIKICLGNECQKYEDKISEYNFSIKNNSNLNIQSDNIISYLVIKEVKYKKVRGDMGLKINAQE